MQSYKVLEAKIVCKHFLDFLTEERNFFFVRVTTEIMKRRKNSKNFVLAVRKNAQ